VRGGCRSGEAEDRRGGLADGLVGEAVLARELRRVLHREGVELVEGGEQGVLQLDAPARLVESLDRGEVALRGRGIEPGEDLIDADVVVLGELDDVEVRLEEVAEKLVCDLGRDSGRERGCHVG